VVQENRKIQNHELRNKPFSFKIENALYSTKLETEKNGLGWPITFSIRENDAVTELQSDC